jgi:hypothetical protein
MGEPSPFKAWPDVPTRVIPCRDDRLFPASFLRRIGRERLGITPEEIEGGILLLSAGRRNSLHVSWRPRASQQLLMPSYNAHAPRMP